MNKQKYLRAQINYRGLKVVRNPGASDTETSEWITMQQDIRALLKFGEQDQFLVSGSVSQTPNRGVDDGESNFRSREYYIGYRFKRSGLYVGLLDKVYGIRVVEHIAFSRIFPQVTQNDQSHGVMYHFLTDNWEGGASLFMGNLSQEEPLRLKGGSLMIERTVDSKHRIGASVMTGESQYLNLLAYAAHARLSFEKGSSLQFEVGQTKKKGIESDLELNSRYGFLQSYLRPFRGMYFFTNIEYAKQDISRDDYLIRWGPGLQFLPIHRTEFRVDLQNIRNFDPEKSVKDSWQILLQTHFWL
jgi:hypothetical protein